MGREGRWASPHRRPYPCAGLRVAATEQRAGQIVEAVSSYEKGGWSCPSGSWFGRRVNTRDSRRWARPQQRSHGALRVERSAVVGTRVPHVGEPEWQARTLPEPAGRRVVGYCRPSTAEWGSQRGLLTPRPPDGGRLVVEAGFRWLAARVLLSQKPTRSRRGRKAEAVVQEGPAVPDHEADESMNGQTGKAVGQTRVVGGLNGG